MILHLLLNNERVEHTLVDDVIIPDSVCEMCDSPSARVFVARQLVLHRLRNGLMFTLLERWLIAAVFSRTEFLKTGSIRGFMSFVMGFISVLEPSGCIFWFFVVP